MNELEQDALIERMFPLHAASSAKTLMESQGVRYIVASDGLWQEVHASWLRLRHNIAPSVTTTPYGATTWHCEFLTGDLPIELFRDFVRHARRESPTETAGLIVWNQTTHKWRLALRESLSASSGHVRYRNPSLGADEVAIVDVHSHGLHDAFFSSTDDEDDRHALQISWVVGNLADQPNSVMRLCASGRFYALDMDSQGRLRVCDRQGEEVVA